MISLKDVQEARERIRPYVYHTPLLRAHAMDEDLGCEVYLKLESMQVTGSFKARGAFNAVMTLPEEERGRGVIASSSGNHAQGLALAAKTMGVKATIVMPNDVNPVKLQHVKDYGAEAVLVDVMERDRKMKELSEEKGYVIVHAFENPYVKAGQGTAGLEIMEDLPDADVVITPLGGGGLLSGVATAVKGIRPEARVYGVESVAVPRYTTVFRTGELKDLTHLDDTIADGVRGAHVCADSCETIKARTEGIVSCTDEEVKEALRILAEKGRVLAEPCSCLTIAAVRTGKISVQKTDKVVFVLSGGNFRSKVIAQILGE